jgi:hypothetical protein
LASSQQPKREPSLELMSLLNVIPTLSLHFFEFYFNIIRNIYVFRVCTYVRMYAVLPLRLETKILYVDTPHIHETTKLYVKLHVKTEILELRSSCIRRHVVSTLNMKAGRSFEAYVPTTLMAPHPARPQTYYTFINTYCSPSTQQIVLYYTSHKCVSTCFRRIVRSLVSPFEQH